MRYEDASGSFSAVTGNPDARDDADVLPANSHGPATGNTITGAGTITGLAGADLVSDGTGKIVALEGATGSATADGGDLRVGGRFGDLTMDTHGNYKYTPNVETPNGARDVFRYTLADNAGARDAATLTIEIGREPQKIDANAQQIIPGPDGVVTLPPGVELSDVHVVGRNLVIDMPDGTQMVIVDGAVFVPQLVLGGVEVPATNLAALLIDAEPQPAAGIPQSSGGNFDVPVPPLDPGVPLGDLIPPTELVFTPPEFHEVNGLLNHEPEAGSVTVQLDDDVIPGKNGNLDGVGDDNPDVVGQNVVSGSLPGSGGDGALTWDLLTSGNPAGFTYLDGPNGSVLVQQVQGGNAVTVLTITINPATGAYSVTENAPILHAAGGDENNALFTINYTVTDSDGDSAPGTLNINVDDDTPTVSVSAGSDAEVSLTTHDAATIGAASEAVSTSANFAGVFSGSTSSPGADGAGVGGSSGYALTTTGGASGLFSHGVAINLYNVGGVIVGSTSATAPASATDASVVFSVATDSNGVVTLTQYSQIDHTNTDPSPTGAPFTDHSISLTDGSITLTRSVTVVDKDGDSVTGSAAVGIGANLHFVDDGPAISLADRGEATLVVDETNLAHDDTQSFAANFSATFGADGPAANSLTYALGISAPSANSGLVDVATGLPIVLVQNGAVVEGHVGTAAGALSFTVSVNAAGDVTLNQILAIQHTPDTGPDQSTTLSADNLVTLTATAHDFDGDTASSTINIGTNLVFHDDAPSVSDLHAGPGVTLDETAAVTPAGFPISANSAGPVITGTTAYGADGAGTTAYGLTVVGGGVTALKTAIGDFAITLVQSDAQTITGQYNDGSVHTAFTVHINADGTITVTENVPLEHNVDGSTAAAYNDSLSLAGLVDANITVTDRDNDTASGSVGIGGSIVFLDDGPSITVSTGVETGVVLETQDAQTIGAGVQDTDSSTLNFSGVFSNTPVGGADGAAGAATWAYTLGLTAGAVSGLTSHGATINLYQLANGTIVGSTSGSAPASVADASVVFAVSVAANGAVTLTQYQQVDHALQPGANDAPFADQATFILDDHAITLTGSATVFDNDGDSATDSKTIDIASNLHFDDDGPDISATLVSEKTIRIDETDGVVALGGEVDPIGGGNLGTVTVARAAYLTVSDVHVSADAPTTNSYALSLGTPGGNGLVNSGLILSTTNAPIYLYNVGGTVVGSTALTAPATAGDTSVVFTVSINASGDVTLTQILAVEHGNIASVDEDSTGLAAGALNVVVTATDFDGDTDKATVDLGSIIRFEDDGPSIDVTTNPEAGILVTTHDALTIAGATDSSSASFAGAFNLTSSGGSDGAANTPALSYVLGVPGSGANGVDSNLDQTGANIYLYKIGNLVVGSTSATLAGVNAGNKVFDVGVVASGVNAGTVTLTQYSQIDHPLQVGLNDAPFADQLIAMADGLVTLTASSTITDNDGDIVTDSALINIGTNLQFADHGPTATNDVDNIAAGFFGTATGNVLTGLEVAVAEDTNASDGNADNVGADTPGSLTLISSNNVVSVDNAPDGAGNFVVNGQYGVLTINANGDYSYDRNEGSAGGVSDVFTYTLTDRDGDTVTATLTINIGVNPPVATTSAATVDDDGLVGSPAGLLEAGKDDINANVGETPSTNASEAIYNGHLGVTGGDGAIAFNLIATGAGIVVGQETVTISGSGTLLTATITASPDASRIGTALFNVSLDASTGNYTVTLLDNVLHGDDANDNEDGTEVQVAIHYQVTDAGNNHSAADGVLTISFNDDTPVNNAATYNIGTVFEDGLNTVGVAVGNLDGGSQPASIQILGASLAGLVDAGADTPLAIGLNTAGIGQAGSIEGTATGLTQNGVSITWHVVSATQIDGVIGGNVIFSINDNPGDTNFTFTLKDNIDNNPTAAGDADTDPLALAGVFTATDADGDKIVINAGASIDIQNDVPINNGTSYNAGTVHEDALNTAGAVGNPEGGQVTNIQILGASLAGLVTPGADAPVTISLNGLAVGQPGSIEGTATGLTQNGVSITWHVVSATEIDGVIGGNVIFTVTDNPGDANFTFTLKDNIDNNPTAAGDADTDSLSLAGVFVATDTDGDKVIIDAGATVLIQNDVPINNGTSYNAGTVYEDGLNTVGVAVGNLEGAPGSQPVTVSILGASLAGLVTPGADAPVAISLNGLAVGQPGSIDGTATGLTQGGVSITWHVVSATEIDGVIGGNVIFTVTDNPGDANFTFTLKDNIDNNPTTGAGDADTDSLSLAGVFVATDTDGDKVIIDAGATVLIQNDVPITTATLLTGTVDEDGVSGGIAGGTGDVTGEITIASGSVATLFSAGADAPLTYSLLTNTTGLPALTSGGVAVTYAVAGNTLTASAGAGHTVFTFVLNADGSYTFTLVDNLDHAAGNNENDLTIALGSIIAATDTDGDSVAANANGLVITVDDDSPTLGTVQNQTVNNDPTQAPAVGTLHFAPGADGAGSAMTITANVTGLLSGGHSLVTHQVGNVLTAYQDIGPAGWDAGDTTAVFTITVDPAAGTSGQYTFNLITPLDPTVTETAIGGSSSFGAGPTSQGQVLDNVAGTAHLAVVSGYHMGGTFNEATWLSSGSAGPTTNFVTAGVNGSTAGWGIDNNNFNGTDEMFVWDFGSQALRDPDGAGAYVPAAGVTLPDISTATYDLIGYNSGGDGNFATGDDITYVVHYTDGTFTSGHVPEANVDSGTWKFTAAAGKFIADIEMFASGTGSGKVDLVSVGVQSTNLDKTISASVQLTDGDGDQTSVGNFTIHIATGLSPAAPVPPVVLDLNGDGVHFLSASDGVSYDYGHGAVATAWAAPEDGILVRDANTNGTVDDGSEFVFGANGLTDLQSLAAQYGSTLDANDADFAKFAVWQDANSNGVADAGEVQSLTALGITSISLTSDGISYTAANGDVTVAGTGSYTNADGSTGVLADAMFKTGSAANDDQRSLSTANNNSVLLGAIAAAGLGASVAAAAHDAAPSGQHVADAVSAVAGSASALQAPAVDSDDNARTALTGETRQAVDVQPHGGSSAHHEEAASGNSLTAGDSHGSSAPAPLLEGTETSAQSAPAQSNFTSGGVAMPSAAMLAAANANHAVDAQSQSTGEVSRVLADALAGGGHGPNIDAVIDAAANQAHGSSQAAVEALASHGPAAVSGWDMASIAGFTTGHAAFTMEHMAAHMDAAPAAA